MPVFDLKVWRCWTICNRSWMAAIIPLIFNLGSIGMWWFFRKNGLINTFSSWDNKLWFWCISTDYSSQYLGASATELILTIGWYDCTMQCDNSLPNHDGITYARSKLSTTSCNGNCYWISCPIFHLSIGVHSNDNISQWAYCNIYPICRILLCLHGRCVPSLLPPCLIF